MTNAQRTSDMTDAEVLEDLRLNRKRTLPARQPPMWKQVLVFGLGCLVVGFGFYFLVVGFLTTLNAIH